MNTNDPYSPDSIPDSVSDANLIAEYAARRMAENVITDCGIPNCVARVGFTTPTCGTCAGATCINARSAALMCTVKDSPVRGQTVAAHAHPCQRDAYVEGTPSGCALPLEVPHE